MTSGHTLACVRPSPESLGWAYCALWHWSSGVEDNLLPPLLAEDTTCFVSKAISEGEVEAEESPSRKAQFPGSPVPTLRLSNGKQVCTHLPYWEEGIFKVNSPFTWSKRNITCQEQRHLPEASLSSVLQGPHAKT